MDEQSHTSLQAAAKPKLLFFDFITHLGGAPRSTTELASHLKAHYDIRFVDAYGYVSDFAKLVQSAGISYEVLCPDECKVVIGSKGQLFKRALATLGAIPSLSRVRKKLREVVRREAPDLLWTSSIKALSVLHFAVDRHAPILYYARGAADWSRVPFALKRLLKSRVNLFLCLGQAVRENVLELGVAAEKVKVVPNAVDMERFEGVDDPDPALPMMDKPVRILLPGSLVERKGQTIAVRVLGELVTRQQIDAVLYFAGDEPAGSQGAYGGLLKKMSADLGVSDRVCYLGWRRDILNVTRACTCVVLPSSDEGMSRAIMESMAMRRPVISTPVGATAELLRDGEAGWIVPVNDAKQLAKALLEQIRQPELSQRKVEAAYRHISENYSRAAQTRAFIAAVQPVLDKK